MVDTGGHYYLISVVSYIRLAMCTFGDIIPLAYRLDPEVVIYRIGPRYYMVTIEKDEEDGFTFTDGALPNLDINQPLSEEFLENLIRSNGQDNLDRYGNVGEIELLDAAERIDSLLDVVAQNAYRLELEQSKIGSEANS